MFSRDRLPNKVQNLTVALLGGLLLQRDTIERKSTSGDNRNNDRCEGNDNDRCDFGSSPGQVASENGEQNEIHNRQKNEEMELLDSRQMGRQLYKMFRSCSNGRVVDLEQVDRWIADNGINSTNVLEMMRGQGEANP